MKLISVWGSPGGGKTTLSVELAKKISLDTQKNVVLIFPDDQASPISYLFPSLEKEGGSLGSIVATAGFNQEAIKKTLVNHRKNKYLAFLGYRDGESRLNYPEMVESQVIDLFIALGHLFDYCIVDCQSNVMYDRITQYALRYGEVVMLGGGDLKSIAFFKSISSQIQDYPGIRQAISAVNNPWDFETWKMMAEKYNEKVTCFFPYSADLQMAYLEGTSIEPFKNNHHNKEWHDALTKLMSELLEAAAPPEVNPDEQKSKKKNRVKKEKKPKVKRRPFFGRKKEQEVIDES
ncbi:ParA family protein [Acetobacterium woodii]|uniref:CobQ/CobB/MinD/ParA nucleotide binding domain-containing protein n=1 Tax=Acetobacterium woodii (strain ATCC 29683 / DSM 1030 / JCM 2381 / KCTC 1655 / WB1) TaxID=931626 RepID=H6LDE6_ACEWD|nr:ParA family protein [Acetobacterium woodii]AFA47918.1 hypothetical protein Awo_c11340 [Acetobacterium woodii DSM 1030]